MAEYADLYQLYLQRFAERFGAVAEGTPVRNEGRLVYKLSQEEFEKTWHKCDQLERFLRDSISAGYTLSDAVEDEYVALCAQVLRRPKDFKTV